MYYFLSPYITTKKKLGNTLDFQKILYIGATAKIMQTRMLYLRTRTQQTLTLILTAWCAACATLECDRALKNAQEMKNVTIF
jgi:hypothetical protein